MKDADYLLQTLALAKRRRGFCAPNPSVGALIVQEGEILASGYHEKAGAPHAEILAFNQLKKTLLKEATLYVSLEPCSHHGKTPPCVEAIILQGIKRVVFGFMDPNPQVMGSGQDRLIQANIACEHLPLPEIEAFYRSYAFWHQYHRPYVTAKLAISLDNKIAGPNGIPAQITGTEAKEYTHQMRQKSDAILTTAQTIIADNPQLNVRLKNKAFKKPLYVLDSKMNLPLQANVLSTAESITLFYHEKRPERLAQLQSRGVRCIPVPKNKEGLDLMLITDIIGQDGVHDLWLEAGSRCFMGFHRAGLVQRTLLYVASKWLGTQALPVCFDRLALIDDASKVKWWQLGEDSVCELTW